MSDISPVPDLTDPFAPALVTDPDPPPDEPDVRDPPPSGPPG